MSVSGPQPAQQIKYGRPGSQGTHRCASVELARHDNSIAGHRPQRRKISHNQQKMLLLADCEPSARTTNSRPLWPQVASRLSPRSFDRATSCEVPHRAKCSGQPVLFMSPGREIHSHL
jgi:hypothetical protein